MRLRSARAASHATPSTAAAAVVPVTLRGASRVGIALLAALTAFYQVRTYDTFFHLAAGRFIVEHGRVPEVDPFSFTFRGAPWHNHSALAELILHGIERAFGFQGLSLMQALCAALLVAVPLRQLRKSGLDPRFAVGLLLLGPLAFREVLVPRPHLFGFLALQASGVCLLRHGRGGGAWALAPLPLIYVLWLGCHGSHLLLPVLLAVLLAVSVLGRRRREALETAAVLVACLVLLVTLAPGALRQGVQHVADPALAHMVPEWQPLRADALLFGWPGRAFLLVWVSSLLGAVLALSGKLSGPTARLCRDPRLLAGCAVSMAVALTSARMVPLFMLAAAPFWLPLASATWRVALVAPWRALPRRLRGPAALALPLLLTVGVLSLPCDQRLGWGLERSRFPIEATDYLAAHPELSRVYNAYNYGGYLMYRGVPREGVFIDGRAITVYPPEFMLAFDQAYDGPAPFEALAARFAVNGVLMPLASQRTPGLIAYLRAHPAWAVVHEDAVSVLFAKRSALGSR